LHKALELDSTNARARDELTRLSRPIETGDRKLRYYAAASIFLAGLVGAAFVLWRPKRQGDVETKAGTT
jgi:hypothetical protein